MNFREIFILTKGTKVILGICISVSVLTLVFAFFYYRNINNSEDPRVKKGKEFLYRYEKSSGSINSIDYFYLLDSAFSVFKSFPDYENSFEIGVIYNNKCSGLLLMALYDSTINNEEKSKILKISLDYCDSSILNYKKWISEWGNLNPEVIAGKLEKSMNINPAFSNSHSKKVFERRIKNIVTAQLETPRRLSVSLTNKGTIYRHLLEQDSAVFYYQMAMNLWKDNRIAKSNMNVLMGGEPIKPSVIESLFPPDRNKNQ